MAKLLLAAILLIQSQNGAVTGRLLSAPGTPAVGVRVTAKPVADPAAPAASNVFVSIGETDASGRYRLENVPPGRYNITAGLVAAPTYYPGTSDLGDSTPIDIKAGAIANVPDFIVQQTSIRPPFPLTHIRPAAGPLSFDIKAQTTNAFETIASAAGLTVVFDRDFRGTSVQLKLENADINSALNAIATAASAFWVPYDSSTILVASDNPTKRRDYDLRVLPSSSPVATVDAAGNLFVAEPAGLRNVTPYRSDLQPRAGAFSLDTSIPTREAYEKFAESAGINVVFDSRLRTFAPDRLQKLDNVDFFKALDLLSVQTKTFWIPLDSKTIFVASDNTTARRDYEPQIVKTFYLNVKTAAETNYIMNVVRLDLNVTNAVANVHAKAIVIRDTPQNMALAEMLIARLNNSNAPQSSAAVSVRTSAEVETYSVGNTFIRDFPGRNTLTPVRSQLQPTVDGPISISVNASPRGTYEALAKAAGLQVTFDPRFVTVDPISFHVDNASIFDALTILSYQTRTYWRVVDKNTILVAPATYSIRNELEPRVQKSVPLRNVRDPQDISGIVNAVRQLLLIQSGIAPNAAMNAIEITETAEKVAVAEAMISALDVP